MDESVDDQESLRLARRFELPHLPLSLPRRLVRDLDPVVCVLPGAMDDRGHDLAMRSGVASQLVGEELPGHPALPFQQLPKEAFGGFPITAWLNEDVEHVTVLVHRTPEILPLSLDGDEDLVQVPDIAEAPLALLESSRVLGSKSESPKSDRFIRNGVKSPGMVIHVLSGKVIHRCSGMVIHACSG